MRYLTDCLGHEIIRLEISDAGRFRDFCSTRGMSSSSVKARVLISQSSVNLAIREQGLAVLTFSVAHSFQMMKPKQQRTHSQRMRSTCSAELPELDDEPRWLIALSVILECVLSEACGFWYQISCWIGERPISTC